MAHRIVASQFIEVDTSFTHYLRLYYPDYLNDDEKDYLTRVAKQVSCNIRLYKIYVDDEQAEEHQHYSYFKDLIKSISNGKEKV